MSCATSPSTGRRYGVLLTCSALGVSRASFYRQRARMTPPQAPLRRRGPRPRIPDQELLAQIRAVLLASPFVGEGHRKVWARLRFADVRVGRRRVLRVMRENNLLAPVRVRRDLGPRVHDGTIIPEAPNLLWGTDATGAMTVEDGQVTVFIGVDHFSAECVGIHAAKPATRFEALEVIRQGVRARFGRYDAGVAAGLKLRHDHGPQFISDDYQAELRFLGIESSPAFVRSPEGNGCAERFIRTLKEQILWARTFKNVEDLRRALLDFADTYNRHWLVERHGFTTPAQARASFRKAA